MRRVKTPVTLQEARERLEAHREKYGRGPFPASCLAYAIWPDTHWVAAQGAGASAVRVLKRLGCYWTSEGHHWGWIISFPEKRASHNAR